MVTEKDLLTVKINKICHSNDFNKYYCSKFKFAPTGMTLDLYEDNKKFKTNLVSKTYGYESTSTGFCEFEDLDDYIINDFDFTPEQHLYVLKYFQENYPEIYSKLN